MSRRQRVLGFEQGIFYANQPSDGNVTIDATAKRSGNYGLHVNGQSGVSSFVQINAGQLGTTNAQFARWYMQLVNLPTTGRIIAIFDRTSASGGFLELFLTTAGKIALRNNGTVLATSSSSLATGRFYRIEVGASITTEKFFSLRIDGNEEIAWFSTSGQAPSFTNITMGVVDTVAAALAYYIDDFATDASAWCGPGRVVAKTVTSVVTDNANFTATGAATKWQAVSELPPDDATSYLDTGVTSAQRITFGLDAWPDPLANRVYGHSCYIRMARSGASNGAVDFTLGFNAFLSTNTSQQTSTAAYATVMFTNHVAYGPMGPMFTKEFLNSYRIALRDQSANSTRVTAVWLEIDYDDGAGAADLFMPGVITSFEDGLSDTNGRINSSTAGTFDAASTAHVHSGTYACKITHASGGKSSVGWSWATDWFSPLFETYCSFWFYVETLPTSGSMDIFWVSTSTLRNFAVFVDSNGALNSSASTINGTGSATANGTIVVGQWYHLALAVRSASAGATVNDGQLVVRLNDKTVHTRTACNPGLNGLTSNFERLGSGQNVTGGGIVHYDDLVNDFAYLHHKDVKFATLVATGVGAITAGATTPVGDTPAWKTIDETPNDGDTTYLTTPLTNTLFESYQMSDMPASTRRILGAQITAVSKRDAASDTSFRAGLIDQGAVVANLSLASPSSTSAYTSKAISLYDPPTKGEWTTTVVASAELVIGGTSITLKARVTLLYLTVLYLEQDKHPVGRSNALQVVG